jgi:hypothetical protein
VSEESVSEVAESWARYGDAGAVGRDDVRVILSAVMVGAGGAILAKQDSAGLGGPGSPWNLVGIAVYCFVALTVLFSVTALVRRSWSRRRQRHQSKGTFRSGEG